MRIVPHEAFSKWWTEGMRQLFCPSFKDASCQAPEVHTGDSNLPNVDRHRIFYVRAQFCGSTNRRPHTKGGVRLESIETGAETEKGAAQRRSPILPGRENVAAIEREQLSIGYAQFPCHFPATISNRNSGTLNLYQLHSRKKKRKLNITP